MSAHHMLDHPTLHRPHSYTLSLSPAASSAYSDRVPLLPSASFNSTQLVRCPRTKLLFLGVPASSVVSSAPRSLSCPRSLDLPVTKCPNHLPPRRGLLPLWLPPLRRRRSPLPMLAPCSAASSCSSCFVASCARSPTCVEAASRVQATPLTSRARSGPSTARFFERRRGRAKRANRTSASVSTPACSSNKCHMSHSSLRLLS